MLRLTRWLLFTLVAMLWIPLGLPAQAGNLNVETRSGFDGYYRPGAWVPVFVTISNQPTAGQTIADLTEFTGQLMLITYPGGGDSQAVRFAREIAVPPSSKKQYTLYAKLSDAASNPELLLNSANGKREATYKLDLNPLDEKSLLVVNVSESLSRPNLPTMRGGLDKILYSKIPPSELPEHWAAWDSADVVVLDGWPAAGVSMEATQALRDWVAAGGTLAMLGGVNTTTYTEPLAKELLPVDLTGSAFIQEGADGLKVVRDAPPQGANNPAYVVALNSPKPGTDIMMEVDSVPMVVSQSIGKGRIVFVANDFKSASASLERAFFPAWQAVCPLPDAADPSHEMMDALNLFKSLTGRAARPPNHLLIILICVIYMLAVGPLNFGLLSKRKKLEWAWFTVPAIVLVFFLMIYGFGRFTKGNASLYYELSLENYHEGSNQGSAITVGSSFVSSSANHLLRPTTPRHVLADGFRWQKSFDFRDLSIMGGAMAIGTTAMGGSGGTLPLTGTPPLVQYDTEKSQIFIRNWEMSTFDARSFFGGGPVELKGAITSDLQWESGAISGRIINGSDRNFDECYLLCGTRLMKLNALKAGEAANILPTRLPIANGGGGGWLGGADFFASKKVDLVDDAVAVSDNNFGLIMETLLDPKLTGKVFPPNPGRFCFVGFQRTAGEPATLTSIPLTDKHRAVGTIVELNVRPPSGSFEIASSTVPIHLLDWAKDNTAGGVFYFGEDGTLKMVDSALQMAAELPFRNPKVTVSQFMITTDAKAITSQEVVVEVFSHDPASSGWIKVPFDQWIENRRIALPISGRIYLRIRSQKPATPGQSSSYWETTEIREIGVSYRGTAP